MISTANSFSSKSKELKFSITVLMLVVFIFLFSNCKDNPTLSVMQYSYCSVFEMPHSRHHHRHSMPVAIVNTLVVFHRAARLNDCFDAGFVSNLHAVGKRK